MKKKGWKYSTVLCLQRATFFRNSLRNLDFSQPTRCCRVFVSFQRLSKICLNGIPVMRSICVDKCVSCNYVIRIIDRLTRYPYSVYVVPCCHLWFISDHELATLCVSKSVVAKKTINIFQQKLYTYVYVIKIFTESGIGCVGGPLQ